MSKKVYIGNSSKKPKNPGSYFRFLCLTGTGRGTCYYTNAQTIIFGREDTCDIQVHDTLSSRQHMEIVFLKSGVFVTDLNSNNGVYVNGNKIKQSKIKLQDKITIGRVVYLFDKVDIVPNLERTNTKKKEPKKSPLLIILICFFFALILFSNDGTKEKPQRIDLKVKSNPVQYRNPEKGNGSTSIKNYLKRGLRESRENNYFRAITEFETALSIEPNNMKAKYYLEKTKHQLNDYIENTFLNAIREERSLKFENAIKLHCSIVRLLKDYPEDERSIKAKKFVEKLNNKLGVENRENSCL